MNSYLRGGLIGACMLLLANCTPADIEYCSQFGVAGTAEYGKCLSYYHEQEAAFSADYGACAYEADATYPRSLYDTGRFAPVVGGGYGGRYYGGGYGGGFVTIPPDYYHNAQVDALRARIINPCMDARGWNSPNSWQAGRHSVRPDARRGAGKRPGPAATSPQPVEKLPWLQ